MSLAPAPEARLRLTAFRELWLHTGTACNLSCPFCHEASAPGDQRLGAPDMAQTLRALDQAAALGVERFAFTGGEPLILKGILDILIHAQRLRPCLVLTNGTAPLLRRAQHLQRLRAGPHPVSFRVSIDHPDEAQHDAGRGLKTWRKAIEGLRLLHAAGFEVGITRMAVPDEDAVHTDRRFRALLRRQGLPEDLPIVALPELGRPGDAPIAPALDSTAIAPACTRSRMLVQRAGVMSWLPCPLVDDDPSMALGADLETALAYEVQPRHARCGICRSRGVDYTGVS
jgi:sulfatase maturation enzyme AslB (radical SAM superfamily)